MGPRLRELAPPAARGSQEVEFTQPRVHLLADPCTYAADIFLPHLCRDDGSVKVQLGVGFPIAGVDFQRLRVEVVGRRPVGALEDRVALVLLLLQLLGLLVDVLGLLVVGRQSQDLRSDRKVMRAI